MIPSCSYIYQHIAFLLLPPLEHLEGRQRKEVKFKFFFFNLAVLKFFKSKCLLREWTEVINLNKTFLIIRFYLSILPSITVESWLYFLFLYSLAWCKDILEHSRSTEFSILKGPYSAVKKRRSEPLKVCCGSRILILCYYK